MGGETMRVAKCGLGAVAVVFAGGFLGGFLSGTAARAQALATGDTRTVTEPVFPASCAVLASQQAIVSGGPASETAFDTTRIQAALTACPAGQGVELTTSGTNDAFLIQPLNIPAGVGLIVDGGVSVFASRNPTDYQTASTELCGSYGSAGNGCNVLLNFIKGTGSGLYGFGVIDARGGSTMLGGPNPGETWWANADKADTAVLGQDNPILMKPSSANSFTMYKITLRNSPEFHVGWSGTGLTVWGVKISTPFPAHNTDGIDPTGTNVTITNSSISDGDDDVAVGASSASANVTVSNTVTYSGHGISVGSYTGGGLTNFLVTNVNMAGTASDTNATGLRLKSSEDRGGLVQTVTYQNICIRDIHFPLQVNPFYNTNTGTSIPTFSNIVYSNVHFLTPTTNQYPYSVQLQGHDANHLSTLTFNNLVFDSLNTNQVTPAPEYDTITLGGNVYPAFLQSLTGTGVSYNGTATATAGAGVSACTNVFPYIVGELFESTATATNLKTATISKAATLTLNAMVEPAMSQTSFSGTAGSWTGVAAPSAAINFYEGATVVGTATLSANGTLASATLSNLVAGPHTYTAAYPGDTNYPAISFGSVTVTVTSATTATTTVLTAPATGTFGTSTTLSATVTGTGGTPTGTVAFYDGANLLGSGTLTAGTATLAVTFAGGTHSLSAVYSGDATFITSTSTKSTLTVSTATSSTAVTANPTTVSQNFTTVLTATVTGVSGQAKPTGTVAFTDGTTSLGNAALNSSGVATFTATLTTTGSRTIMASYSGDGNYAISSGTVAVTVTSTTSATALTAPATAVYGVATAFTAKVTSSATGTPTGTVTIYDGTTAVGTGTLASASTTISLTLPGGVHSLTAVYSGDANFPSSTSAASTFTVTVASTSTTLTITPTTVQALSPTANLTATVNGVATAATPTGTVTFSDGSTVIGTGMLTGNTATFAGALPIAGTRTITAAYSGDMNYAVSSGTAIETVTAVPTTTTLTASPATIYGGGMTTLTATVAGAASGTVTFNVSGAMVGTGTVNASGVATYVYTAPAGTVGSLLATASYAASGAYGASTSTAITLTVGTAVSVSSSASAITVTHGSSGMVTLTLTPGGGFTGAVAVSCASPVKYVTCSVSTASVTLSGTTPATVTGTINVASTTSALEVRGDGTMLALLGPLGLLGLAFASRRRKLRKLALMITFVCGLGAAIALSGCAGGSSSGSSGSSGNVPSGTQLVTFTATAAGVSQTVTVAVTIQ
jgi:hypothetical protein